MSKGESVLPKEAGSGSLRPYHLLPRKKTKRRKKHPKTPTHKENSQASALSLQAKHKPQHPPNPNLLLQTAKKKKCQTRKRGNGGREYM